MKVGWIWGIDKLAIDVYAYLLCGKYLIKTQDLCCRLPNWEISVIFKALETMQFTGTSMNNTGQQEKCQLASWTIFHSEHMS